MASEEQPKKWRERSEPPSGLPKEGFGGEFGRPNAVGLARLVMTARK